MSAPWRPGRPLRLIEAYPAEMFDPTVDVTAGESAVATGETTVRLVEAYPAVNERAPDREPT